MHSLRELLEVSAFEPKGGYSLDLSRMAKAGIERPEALRKWVKLGRSEGSFYKAYKALKDDLVRMAFVGRKDTGQENRRLDIWDRFKVVNQLLILNKKQAAVSLAIELMNPAIKAGISEVVVSLAVMLEGHFGGLEIDTRRYLRYRKIRKDYSKMLDDEMEVRALQAKLVFSVNRNKSVDEFENEVDELKRKKTGSYIFMRYRFSVLSTWFELKNDTEQLVNLTKETLEFYRNCPVDLPPGAMQTIYLRTTPIIAKAGRFAEAEANISKALEGARQGTHNWHLFMLQKACLGFQSCKLGIVRAALKLAQEAPREHANTDIDRRWGIVESIVTGRQVDDAWQEVLG